MKKAELRRFAGVEPAAEILSGAKDLAGSGSNAWCERGDSNPHGFTRQILSLVRLPIPPLSLEIRLYKPDDTNQIIQIVKRFFEEGFVQRITRAQETQHFRTSAARRT